MRVGVVVAQDFWLHFRQIFAALKLKHEVCVFQPRKWPYQAFSSRVNSKLLTHDLSYFLKSNDVIVFEWAEEVFVQATHLLKTTPIVVRLHLHELWDFAPRVNWENVDRVIIVSHAMRRKLLERYPQLKDRTHVIHNGIDLERFYPQPRDFQGTLGTLSRLEPHKGIYELVCTFADLRVQGYDLKLKIGGGCTEPRYQRYADELYLLVKRLGIEPYVTFDGYVEDTVTWCRDVDIFISNSCSEGLQVALLEAMACGCYTLSQRWDGADEVLPLENLYFTQRELVDKIQKYVGISEAEKNIERKNLRTLAVERFDIKEKVRQVTGIIEEVGG